MPRKISEDQTRKEMIDPQLGEADWYFCAYAKVRTEVFDHAT